MKFLTLIALAISLLISTNSFAVEQGQIATLATFQSTTARPDGTDDSDNVTSIVGASIEYTLPTNVALNAGFSLITGETFETGTTFGARYYSASPAFRLLAGGAPMWTYLGGGISFYDDTVIYPEAGFRIATSNAARLDVFIRILSSSDKTYDRHIMVGAGLTF